MPLPDRGSEWPPKPFDIAQKDMHVWNAWYTGDVDVLEQVYTENNNRVQARPSQYSGGVVGAFARFFWGRPNPQQTSRLHVPAAADVARTMSDLVYAAPPKIVVGENDDKGGHEKVQARLQRIIGEDDAMMALSESAELASALGGTYLRWWWDVEVDEKVKLGAVAADAAVPTWRYDQLAAVTFWTKVVDENGVVLRHLERHEDGVIFHALFEGDSGRLGRRVPLTEHPSTSWAAKVVDAEGGIATGIDGLTATYIPNVRPNRKWRSTHGLSPLGRSDFDGLEPVFDALDETYSAWMRDVDHGKSRLFVPEDMLKSGGRGGGMSFDSEQAIFTALAPSMGSAASGSGQVQANQFSIRHAEYSATVAELLNTILRGVGISSSSFADNTLTATVGAQTATEVNSRDRLSERTRDRKINYNKAALRPFVRTGIELDAQLFNTGVGLKELPEIRFPIRPQQSPVEMSQTLSALYAVNAISLEQVVRQQHPNWSSDDVNDEIERIKADERRKSEVAMASFQDPGDDGGDEY